MLHLYGIKFRDPSSSSGAFEKKAEERMAFIGLCYKWRYAGDPLEAKGGIACLRLIKEKRYGEECEVYAEKQ